MDPVLAEMLAWGKAGGAALAPVFVVLWWLERQERITAQTQNGAMMERIIIAMQETKTALQTFGVILTSPRNGK